MNMTARTGKVGKVAKRVEALIGQTFGWLQVIGVAGRQNRHIAVWTLCTRCGERTAKPQRLDNLKGGRTISCRCHGRQLHGNRQNNRAARFDRTGVPSRVFNLRCSGQTDHQIAAACRIDRTLVGFIFRRRAAALRQHEAFIAGHINRAFGWIAKALKITVIEAAWLAKRVRRGMKEAIARVQLDLASSSRVADLAYALIGRIKGVVQGQTILPRKFLSFSRQLRKRERHHQLGFALGIDLAGHATTPERLRLLSWFEQSIRDTTRHRREQRFGFLRIARAV